MPVIDRILAATVFTFGICLVFSAPLHAQEVSPDSGALVIAGGSLQDSGIIDRFLQLAGGADSPIVVIPTASEADSFNNDSYSLRTFRQRGATNLTLLHTRDRNVASADSFVQAIHSARGVWFSGGRQWRLADAYLGTRTEKALWALLNRGGVIGGSSAGATIQGSYLVRGDTRTNTIMMGDHTEGFGFLKESAIDQHLLQRNRQFDLIEVLEAHPHLLGIGIDENTAIVVSQDWFEVIGASYVAIYDKLKMLGTEGKFYLLRPGDRFHLPTRTAYRNNDPLEGPVEHAW